MSYTEVDDLSDIINSIDLKDFLDSDGIVYRRAGSGDNLQLRECPFCGNSDWKVYFSTKKKRGLCFKGDCQARFNMFTFVKQSHSFNNKETTRCIMNYASGMGFKLSVLRYVAPIITGGWEMPESIAIPTVEGYTHPTLTARSILPETQTLFGLRWCEKGMWSYRDDDGVDRQMIYDKRIIIPVHDTDGIVKTFVGRDGTGKSDKRYLFPATLPGTGRYLYGAHLLTGKEDHLVITEGPFDVMATHQSIRGFPEFAKTGVVGSFGLSIGMSDDENNDDQLHRLFALRNSGVKKLTFMWDGEVGAFAAAIKMGDKLRALGFVVNIAMLPDDCDPNEVDTACVRATISDAKRLNESSSILWKISSPYKKKLLVA
jgi:DNA primase